MPLLKVAYVSVPRDELQSPKILLALECNGYSTSTYELTPKQTQDLVDDLIHNLKKVASKTEIPSTTILE